ncbi:MAG: glutamate--tRNA ligase [Dehalococcoidales bacterium]|nr:glutamate--tRNA ligase [Dehalococcoidales bacterium]
MTETVRTRFAPSPTGFPHVGNIRTALFAWLFARHHKGSFVVRIEDTDVARTVTGAVEAILEGLRWLNLDWDEGPETEGKYGPYFQSQRLALYKEAAERLVAQGNAYYCYCSPERLEAMRAEQARRKQPPGYDRMCRRLTADECARKNSEGLTPVVRFKTPLEGKTAYHDVIWGDVSFENNTIDDFVLLKSDGYPTYHLANVVDDHAMEITHVIRAEEWISSTPRHLMLYRALGYAPPQFAHLPMILGPDRVKLSKRHGAVSLIEYRDQGYLPEAMFNFLTLLGWSLDDKTEIMTREQIIQNFSLERISKTAAVFNLEKLNWMNGSYIRSLSADEFMRRAMPFLEKGLPPEIKRPLDSDYVHRMMPLAQERARTLVEVPGLVDFFFVSELQYEPVLLIDKKMTREASLQALEAAHQKLSALPSFENDSLEGVLRPLAEELGLKAGQLFGTLRVAVTGRTVAPPLFQTMVVIGRGLCMERIGIAIEKLRRLAG